jgi:hypothetical protein
LLGRASVLEKDSAGRNELKAFIIRTEVSGYIQKRLDAGEVDRNQPDIAFVVSVLNKSGFQIMPEPPSGLEKLLHYLSTGNYGHIWDRFTGRNFHIYFIVLVFVFSFILIFRKFNLKVMKKITALFVFFLLMGTAAFAQRTEQIPFEKAQSGLMYFNASINGVKGKFLFDTGASGVVINTGFFQQMESQGLVSQADYLGNIDVVGINNIKVNVKMYNIKTLNIDSFRAYDLQAFLMPDTDAELIIGQSVFEKLGKVSIDNQNNVLLIEMPSYAISEIRFVPCSNQNTQLVPIISQAIDSTLTVTTTSVETNVPPLANAVNRVDTGITIRYFDMDTKDIAEFIKSEIEHIDEYQNIHIYVENMLPYMPNEIKSYIEIWLKE